MKRYAAHVLHMYSKECNCFFHKLFIIILSLVLLTVLNTGYLWTQETIAEGDVTVKGLALAVDPLDLTVPVNTPTVVKTVFSVETPQLLKGMVVKGDLRGPGLSTPITLTTLPNHPFSIPGLVIKGDYYLENIRIERDGEVLLKASPASMTIHAMDIVVTRVETRPLTLEEIRDKGIVITEKNFTAYNFSVGFEIESTLVTYDFPVVYTPQGAKILKETIIKPTVPGLPTVAPSVYPVSFSVPRIELELPEIRDSGEGGGGGGGDLKGVLVFNNDIAFLNQFFSVMFIITNTAPEDSNLALTDVEATINLPEGLREAETKPPHVSGTPIPVRCPGPDQKIGTADDITIIMATFSGMAEFLAEGLKEGTHMVEIDFKGNLTGLPSGDVEISGSAKGAVIVRNPEFSVTFSHPEIVRAGEEYDIYISLTNISPVTANLVSLTMPASRLIGTQLLSEETVSFETVAPGESPVAKFHMVSLETGQVVASAFQAEGNVIGQFVLTAAVGEKGIPLSPDTLGLPSYTYNLPADVVNASVMLLGEAYSIATTPPGGLPDHLPYIAKDVVKARVVELADAGQRVLYGDSVNQSLQVLALDWQGNQRPDISYDILRRMTSKGITLAGTYSGVFNEALATVTPAVFQEQWAETCAYKKPYLSAMLSFNGTQRSAWLKVSDFYQNVLSYENSELTRDIPYGEFYMLEDAGHTPVDLALVGSMVPETDTFIIEIVGLETGTADLNLVLPAADGEFQQVTFPNVPTEPGSLSVITFEPGSYTTGSYTLSTDLDGDGVEDSTIQGSAAAIERPALRLISAIQDCNAHDAGHAVALFFNQPVTTTSAEVTANYSIPGKTIYGAFIQPSRRIILVGVDNAISPFVESRIRVENLVDLKGNLLTPSPTEMAIQATIKVPGGIVYGQVLDALGMPVPNAQVHLLEFENKETSPTGDPITTRSYTRSDASGNYQFDYVRILYEAFEIQAQHPATGKIEKVRSKISVDGQKYRIDIIMRGRGNLHGRVLDVSGTPVPWASVAATAESNTEYEHFTTYSDAQGDFLIADVPLGRVTLYAVKTGLYGTAVADVSAVDITAEVAITIVGGKMGRVSGRVLENDGITPVAGSYVTLGNGTNALMQAKTDQSGYFLFPSAPVGPIELSATVPATGNFGGKILGQLLEGQEFNGTIIFRGNGIISGVVLSYDGVPQSGATVYINGTGLYTTTSGDGEFVFNDVPLGKYNMIAFNTNPYRMTNKQVALTTQGQEVRTSLVYPDTRTGGITGTVYDIDGVTPARSVNVYICDGNYIVKAQTRTDDDGKYSWPDLPVGEYLVAAVRGDTGTRSETAVQYADHYPVCDLYFRGSGKVIVNVKAPDGQTGIMANVAIRHARFVFKQGDMIGFMGVEDTYRTDANGFIEMDNIMVGGFSLEASNSFYPRPAFKAGNISTPGQEVTVQLVMDPASQPGMVKVTVLSPDGVSKVANAKVVLDSESLAPMTLYTGDESQGEEHEAVFSIVPYGGFIIEAEDMVNNFKGRVGGSMGFQGATVSITVRLKGRGTVRGFVRNAQGDAVPDARVTLKSIGYPIETYETRSSILAANLGAFTFYNVPEARFSITAVDDKNTYLGGRAQGEVESHGDLQEVDVYLEASGTVNGRVLSPDSQQVIANAQVILYRSSIAEPFGFMVTAADGSFGFNYVPLGGIRLEVFDAASGRKAKEYGTISMEGEILDLDIPLEGRGTVSGTFFDASRSNPISGAAITIKNTGKFAFEMKTTSDSEGNFRFGQVGEGDFELQAEDPATGLIGKTSGSVDYEDHDVYVDIYAQGSGIFKGKVYRADGTTLVAYAQVVLVEKDEKAALTNAAGEYIIQYVPFGTYTIRANEPGGRDYGTSTGVISFNGQEAEINISFKGLGTIGGTVTDAGGIPRANVLVTVTSISSRPYTYTDSDGKFSFPGIGMGAFTLQAYDSFDKLSAVGSGELTSDGEVADVTLTLEAAGGITGNVICADGVTPANKATVKLIGTGFTRYDTTDATGGFEFDAVKLGSFRIEFEGYNRSGLARRSGTIAVHEEIVTFENVVLDNQAPAVTEIFPGNGSLNIPFDTPITIRFSEALDPATVKTTNIRLLANGAAVSGSVTLDADGRSVAFVPASPLTSFVLYTVIATTAVTDLSGNPMAQAVSASFTTVDTVAPSVASVNPPRGGYNIDTSAPITVTFNEPIVTSKFTTANITLAGGAGAVTGSVSFAGNNTSVVFDHEELISDTLYTVTVQGAEDFAGNVQSQPYTYTFTTADTIAPTLQLNPPASGTTVVEGGSVTVYADTGSSGDIASVHFFINGQFKLEDTVSPYRYTFTAPLISQSGSTFLVEAYALDKAGNQSTRQNLVFTLLSDSEPSVSLSGPTDARVYPGHDVNVSVSALDDLALKSITVSASGSTLNFSETRTTTLQQYSGNFTILIPTDVQPGTPISVSAEAVDSRDHHAVAPALTLQVPSDQELPVVNLLSPTQGQQFNYNDTFTIQAEVSDDVGLDRVIFYKDDEILQTFEKPAVDSVLETTYHVLNADEDVDAVIKAVAVDLVGKQSESQVTVTFKKLIDETLPVVHIISPTDGSLVYPGETLTLKVEVSDDVENGIRQVTFRKDGTELQVVDIPEFTGMICFAEITYVIPTDAVVGSFITFEIDALDVTGKTGTIQSIVGVVTGEFLADGTVIEAGNTTYDNQIIIINSGTVTINGEHNFEHVLVKETGILTHTTAGTTEEFKMDLTLTGKLVVGLGAKLDVSTRGYLGGYQGENLSQFGRTLGNEPDGGSKRYASGSYGGYGSTDESYAVNEMYGTITDPVNPGSGGGGNGTSYRGGNGGGVILLTGPEVIVDGAIYSNGGGAGAYRGAGSGGSIRIDVSTLKGSGDIRANGGSCSSAPSSSGGGGRIAVYYQDASAFDLSKIIAYGGIYTDSTDSTRNGSAGTVYLKKQGETGQLIIDNRAQQSYRPSVFPMLNPAVSTSISGNILENQSAAYMPGSLVGMKLMPDINNPAGVFTITANDRTTITVDGDLSGAAAAGDTYGFVMVFNGHLQIVNTRAELNRDVELGELTVRSNGSISHSGATTTSTNYLSLSVGTITIESGNSIDVSTRGYLGGYQGENLSQYGRTLGNEPDGGSKRYAGGSYGGFGGTDENYPVNDVYGSPYNPVNSGSGGGGNGTSYCGGNGGGSVRIFASTIQLDGIIKSNGGGAGAYRGAGSGGSIRIDVVTLKGSGDIQSNGGSCSSGPSSSGGGGRIAVYYQDASEFDLSKIIAYGGIYTGGTDSTRNGSAGTVYLEKSGQRGQLVIDNNSNETVKGTPLNLASPGTITALNEYILTDANAVFLPGSLEGMQLQPNTTRTETFTIISNTETEIEVEHTADLTTVAAVGDQYQVKHNADLMLEDSMLHIAGSVTVPNLTLNNAQLVLDGTLAVDNLTLQGGSTVTHTTATTGTTYSLRIEAGEILIDEGSSIDASTRGYLGGHQGDNDTSHYGRTLGNVDGSYLYSGAGYGGYGGRYDSYALNSIYGSIDNPTDSGSGGGGNSTGYPGGNGGGVIRIIASEIQLNGKIKSNGGGAGAYRGAGSGGSIRIDVGALSGSGEIQANGGNSSSNNSSSGGGGRIALYYQNASEFNLEQVTAIGGIYTSSANNTLNGSAGTVYLKQEGETARLILNNNAVNSYNALAFPIIEPAVITSVSENVVTGENVNYMPGSLKGMKLIPNIEFPENTFTITANDAATITVDGDLTTATAAGKTYSGIMVFDGRLEIVNTAVIVGRDLEVGELLVTGGGLLKHPAATMTYVSYVSIKTGKVTVDGGSSIDVSGCGYLGGHQGDNETHYGRTLGNVDGSYLYSGGGYGGLGGKYSTYAFNDTYGSLYDPRDPGSGGGGNSSGYPGGNGGGVLRIKTPEIQLDGLIRSNGGGAGAYRAGGSGGSIRIDVTTLQGSGEIQANGGNCTSNNSSSGGGGRIAVYYEDASGFDLTRIYAYGGKHATLTVADYNGGAGTIYLKDKNTAYGELFVNNNSIISREHSTPMPAVGQGFNTALAADSLENTSANFIPGALTGMKLNPNPIGSDVFTIISNNGTTIFTAAGEGDMTAVGTTGGAYIGEHWLFNLTIKGSAKVFTTDRIQVSGTLIVEPGSTLEAENHQ